MNKKRAIILIGIIILIGWTVFWFYDYSKDAATKQDADLYKTVMSRGYIIVGVKTDAKPFGYIENGANAGFDVDMAHHIAKEIFHDERKVKFVPVTDRDRFVKLNSNQVDMLISTITITPKRQQVAAFSNAYYITGQALLVKNGSPIKSLADLSNKNVGVIFGSTAEDTIKFLLPTAHVLGYRSYDDAYAALRSGLILGITSDDAILRSYSMRDAGVKILPKRYSRDSYGIAFRIGKQSDYMIAVVNNLISDMDSRGVFIQMRQKWNLD